MLKVKQRTECGAVSDTSPILVRRVRLNICRWACSDIAQKGFVPIISIIYVYLARESLKLKMKQNVYGREMPPIIYRNK